MKIMCIGRGVYNINLKALSFKEKGKIKISQKHEGFGGDILILANLLSLWKEDVYFAGSAGNDYYGAEIKKALEKTGVNTKYFNLIDNFSSPVNYIISENESIVKNIFYQTLDMKVSSLYDKEVFDVIIMDGEELDFTLDVIKNNKKAIKILHANFYSQDATLLCQKADYIVVSKDFAEQYTNKKVKLNNLKTLVEIYNEMKEEFPSAEIVINLDDKGSFTYSKGHKLVPQEPYKVLFGQNDIYQAVFDYYLINGHDLLDSLRKASIARSYYESNKSIIELKKVLDKKSSEKNDAA